MLAVNANKYRKAPNVLLFTVIEKDEASLATKDGHQNNDDAAVIGFADRAMKKQVMTICHALLKHNDNFLNFPQK